VSPGRLRPWLLATCAALAVFAGARQARALSCGEPIDQVRWIPRAGSTAPRNVQPLVLVERAWPQFVRKPKRSYDGARLVCTGGTSAKTIELSPQHHVGFRYEATRFVPETLLPAGAECAVVHAGQALTWFRTSSVRDERPPRIAGMRTQPIEACPGYWDPCPPGSGNARPQFGAIDDDTGSGQLLLEVWLRDAATGQIDTAKSPAFVSTTGELGGRGDCDLEGNARFPALAESVRVGFTVVDWAGRRSNLVEADLEGPPTGYQTQVFKLRGEQPPAGRIRPSNPLPPSHAGGGFGRHGLLVLIALLGLGLVAWLAYDELSS
jgi:hypothetical protein